MRGRAAARFIGLALGLFGCHRLPPCADVNVCERVGSLYPCQTATPDDDGCPREGPSMDGRRARDMTTRGYRIECRDGLFLYCNCHIVDGGPAWACSDPL